MTPSIYAYLDLLRQTRVLPPEQLFQYQRGLLEKMVRHARAHVPFYRNRLEPLFAEDGRFVVDRWRELPILTRSAAQRAEAELFATEVPADTGAWSERQTSGSTGTPLRHRRSEIANIVSMCVKHRDYEAYRLNFDGALASIQAIHRGPSEIPEGAPRCWNFYSDGPILVFDVRNSIEGQLEWLFKVQAPYLRVYASLLRGLAEHVVRTERSLPFEAMFPFGENLSQETRGLATSVFSGRVIGSYGATEIGRIASECAVCGRYHVPAEIVVVEILRDDGSNARAGEVGRVVVTPLYNFAMPLLRYEIGDLAEVGPDDQCVFTLPTLNRILGRTRNLFKLSDGSRVWPDARTSEMQRYVGLSQVQIVQTGIEEVEVRYVPDGSSRPVNEAGLQEYFRSVIHPSLMVKTVAVNEIARTPSGKFEDYVSLVA